MDIKNELFVEKYRPKELDNVIGEYIKRIKKIINNPKSIPHFLLHSKSPGTGKTSTALAIINELGCDYLILNSSDDRKIDTVRERVKLFATSQSSRRGLKRCIFMDEFDGMLKPSQNALRNIMETYSKNCFFILTCNYIEKVIEPIQSRCVVIDISKPDRDRIKEKILNICSKENMTINNIKYLIDQCYPDIRKMILLLQEAKDTGVTVSEKLLCTEEYRNYLNKIFNRKFKELREKIFSGDIDPKEFNSWLFKNIFKHTKKIGIKAVKKIIFILADNELAFSYGANEDIIFIASILKMMEVLR